MPRKTPPCRPGYERDRSGFNEAAARCRGKPTQRRNLAAPHPRSFNEAAARCRGKRPHDRQVPGAARRASMRPRPDAAENDQGMEYIRHRADASMRPRPDAAENPEAAVRAARRDLASMRPRPDAAENANAAPPSTRRRRGFNEAAARCRGKPALVRRDYAAAADASMRPRPDAAENKQEVHNHTLYDHASMRPRPDAAENRPTSSPRG